MDTQLLSAALTVGSEAGASLKSQFVNATTKIKTSFAECRSDSLLQKRFGSISGESSNVPNGGGIAATTNSGGTGAAAAAGRFGALLLHHGAGRARSPFADACGSGASSPVSERMRSILRRRSSPFAIDKPTLVTQSSVTRATNSTTATATGTGGGAAGSTNSRPTSVIESILNVTPTRAAPSKNAAAAGNIESQLKHRSARASALGGGRKPSVLANALFEHLVPRRLTRLAAGSSSSEHREEQESDSGGGSSGGGGLKIGSLMRTALTNQRLSLVSSTKNALSRSVVGLATTKRHVGLGVRFKKTEIGGLEIVEEAAGDDQHHHHDHGHGHDHDDEEHSSGSVGMHRANFNLAAAAARRQSTLSGNSQRTDEAEECEDLELVPTKFGLLNPRLYKGYVPGDDDDVDFPDDHIGRVWFALKYVQNTEQLVVNVHAIRNLPTRTNSSAGSSSNNNSRGTPGVGMQCDPQVKICLLPDDRRELHTTAKSRNCNPKFFESFVFPVEASFLSDRTLRFTVCDAGNQFKVIGYAFYQFKHFDPKRDFEIAKVFRDLTPLAELKAETPSPELYVALQYSDLRETLTVTVYHGRHFSSFLLHDSSYHEADGGGVIEEDHHSTSSALLGVATSAANYESDVHSISGGRTNSFSSTAATRLPRMLIRVELFNGSRSMKSKESSSVEGSDNPSFNESFHFKVKQRQIDVSSVHVIVERRKFSRRHRLSISSGGGGGGGGHNLAATLGSARRKSHHQIVTHDKTLGRLVLGGFMFARGKGCTHWEQMRELNRQQVQMWHTFS